MDLTIRRARPADTAAIEEMTASLWPDRGGDYLPAVFEDWLEVPGDDTRRTLVAESNDTVVGVVQVVSLSETEVWLQGMRVHPEARRSGVSRRLNEACYEWARGQGARVARVMVYDWNTPSLAAARADGFEPLTAARWVILEPEDGPTPRLDAADCWAHWSGSSAREHMAGLGLAPEESWALRQVHRRDVLAAPAAIAVADGDETVGAAVRTRVADGEDTRVEYGLASWDDDGAAQSLLEGIRRDATDCGGTTARALVPDQVTVVTDVVAAGADVSQEALYVLERPL